MQSPGLWHFAVAGVLLTLSAADAGAQETTRAERFVAASIKPWVSAGRARGTAGPDHYYRVATLGSLLTEAFDVPLFLMSGLPGWASDERWEVSARAEGPRSPDEMRLLLRALLDDRFALRVHHESQEHAVYELVSARADGQRDLRLKPATGECDPFTNGKRPFTEAPVDRYGLSGCLGGVLTMEGRIAVQLHNYTMQRFANALRPHVRRSVVDKTGFPGLFDFIFDFRGSLDSLDSGDVPGLGTALRESLGLKLQSARGTVDVLVIDAVERPMPN